MLFDDWKVETQPETSKKLTRYNGLVENWPESFINLLEPIKPRIKKQPRVSNYQNANDFYRYLKYIAMKYGRGTPGKQLSKTHLHNYTNERKNIKILELGIKRS